MHIALIARTDEAHGFVRDSEGMTRALNRSIPFWILLVVSIGLIVAGTMTVLDHLGTMTTTLKNGSATGLEVYAGQSWIVIGAALLGAGALGILLTLAVAVVSTLLGAATAKPVVIAPLSSDDEADELHPEDGLDTLAPAHEIGANPVAADSEEVVGEADPEAEQATQNGNSGSTATATKISVK